MSESVTELIAELCDETSEVRGQAEDELVKMGARAVDALINVLRIDDHDILLSIVNKVTCAEYAKTSNLFYARFYPLKGGIVPESRFLLKAIDEIADEKNFLPLLDLLKEANAEPRFYAMSALVRIGAQAVAPLAASLGDADDGLWGTALITLGLIGSDDAIRVLIKNLKVPESRTGYRISFRRVTDPRIVRGPFSPAIFALWYIGTTALPPLIEALDDEDEDIRLGAEITLENFLVIDYVPVTGPDMKALVAAGVPCSFASSGYFGITWLIPPSGETNDRNSYRGESRNHALQRLKAFPDHADWYADWYENASPGVAGTPPGGGAAEEWMGQLNSDKQIRALIDRKGEALVDDIVRYLRYLRDHRTRYYEKSDPHRYRGLILLGMAGSPRALQPLLQELKYGYPADQKAAIAALIMLGDRRAILPLERAARFRFTHKMALAAIERIEAGDRNPDVLWEPGND